MLFCTYLPKRGSICRILTVHMLAEVCVRVREGVCFVPTVVFLCGPPLDLVLNILPVLLTLLFT